MSSKISINYSLCHREQSEAILCMIDFRIFMKTFFYEIILYQIQDCFVASILAMTNWIIIHIFEISS